MSDQEYKQHIVNICKRIIREKLINIVRDTDKEEIVFKIQINPIEWYMEMDDDVKFNVEYNLQNLFKPLIIEAIKKYNESIEEGEEEGEEREEEKKILSNCNKRQKT